MKLKWMLGLLSLLSILNSSRAFAGGVASCKQAEEFFNDDAFQCSTTGTHCSNVQCVNTASCLYIKGAAGFTLTFAYPSDCIFE